MILVIQLHEELKIIKVFQEKKKKQQTKMKKKKETTN